MLNRLPPFLLLIFLLFNISYCTGAHASVQKDKQPTIKKEQKVAPDKINAEINILKAQLTLMKEHNQNMISTVLWSLGILATIAVLLVGFSWFTNYKLYERDKNIIKDELLNLINSEINTLKAEFSDLTATKFKDISTNTVSEAKKTLENSLKLIDSQLSENKKEIKKLGYDGFLAEARYWELRGIKGNELTQYISMLKIAIEINGEHQITTALEGIKKMLSEGEELFHGYVPSLIEQIDSLPPKFHAHTDAIKALLK